MGKTVIGVLVVVAVAIAGYLFLGGGPGEEPVATAPAIEDAGEAAADATGTAAETAEQAAETATEMATEAADTASDTAADATDSAARMVDEAKAALGEVLTVDTFDFETVKTAIEGSALGDAEKATLTSALDLAKDDPDRLEAVLQQIRAALDV